MKKILFSLLGLFFLTLISCERDWECKCTIEAFGFQSTDSATIKDKKRKDAKQDCKDFEANVNNVGAKADCSLKPA